LLSKSAAGKLTRKMPVLVLIWVWFCAYLNCAGWALSAIHQLNAGGYAIALLVWFAALFVWKQKNSAQIFPRACRQKFLHRFRKPFPRAFLILAAMAFLGGAIYAPTNYDALAYRIPRILHWLAADQWQWIHTIFPRVNNRSCGIEWVSAPLIALFNTDRFLFLISTVSFLLLPGLVFSVFTRLGVRPRAAWHWMWIMPTGYCFLLQAGSIGNDLFGAPFALAAADFALRAKISKSPRDFFASILAAAMMTSAKTSSLPLLLPWAIAILPSLKLFLRWPVKTSAVCALAIFASALPTMVLNQKNSGDWSGAGINRPGFEGAVFLRTSANVVLIGIQNFAPPVFPMANVWNNDVQKIIPQELSSRLHQVMTEKDAAEFALPELQMEENAGIGFGVSALLLASFLRVKFGGQKRTARGECAGRIFLRWSPAIALLALMMQYGLAVFCRILTPYYALLIPILLAGDGHGQLVRKCWWRASAFAVFFIAAGVLIVSPARPLFPAQLILEKIHGAPARLREVYSVYGGRNDAFAPARAALPPDLKILGMITFDDPETSLWRPFGSRRIEHVCPGDTAADLKARGVEYILVREGALGQWFNCSLDDWLKKMDAQAVQKIPLNLRASQGPADWWLVRLN
jgi:hypothetical protein